MTKSNVYVLRVVVTPNKEKIALNTYYKYDGLMRQEYHIHVHDLLYATSYKNIDAARAYKKAIERITLAEYEIVECTLKIKGVVK